MWCTLLIKIANNFYKINQYIGNQFASLFTKYMSLWNINNYPISLY